MGSKHRKIFRETMTEIYTPSVANRHKKETFPEMKKDKRNFMEKDDFEELDWKNRMMQKLYTTNPQKKKQNEVAKLLALNAK